MDLPQWLSEISRRISMLIHRGRFDRELADEMRAHRALRELEYLKEGAGRDQARYATQRQFGNELVLREESHDAWGCAWLEHLLRDIRFGARMLRKNPGFTAIAVLTLALGIGANTAIFSVLEAQLWKPLPFPESENLVSVLRTDLKHPKSTDLLSGPDFQDWQPQAKTSFENICAFDPGSHPILRGAGASERVISESISLDFFETLRALLPVGRSFSPEEHQAGHDHEVILSYPFWQSHFGGGQSAIGQSLALDGIDYTIVGVAPQGLRFEFSGDPDIYVPLVLTSKDYANRATPALFVVARLKPGVPPPAAQAQMEVIAKRLAGQYPREDGERGIKIEGLRESFVSYAQMPLFFFAGAAALVLLIACANVASLLLARGLARQREFAVRSALGAGRGALVRQLLIEGALLGALGGGLGSLAAVWGAQAFGRFLPGDLLPRKVVPSVDVRVFAFALAMCFVTVLLSALLPGLFASRVDLTQALRGGSRNISAGPGQRRVRGVLVIAEVAMAVALLFGAGLFLNSFIREMRAPLGFDPHNLLSLNVAFPKDRYAQPEQLMVAYDQILQRVAAVPGVRDAGFGSQIPFAGGIGSNFTIVGRPGAASGEQPHSLLRSVTPNYFQLLKIRFLAGRFLAESDTQNSPRVIVVNQNLVRRYFGGENPIGTELDIVPEEWGDGISKQPFRARIVGVVENTHMFGPNEVPFSDIYFPVAQAPVSSLFLVASTGLPAGSILAPIREQITQLDRNILLSHAATMDERASQALRGARGNLALIGMFAGLALALVAVGIFGAIAYFVEQRTREFGIRLALGAMPGRILRHALAQSAVLGVCGLALGVSTSLVLGRLLRSALYLVPGEHTGLLYGVSIYDPLTLFTGCTLLVCVLFLASYIPARKAMRVDPLVALRYE
jgi:putative ABC transport system permease protein